MGVSEVNSYFKFLDAATRSLILKLFLLLLLYKTMNSVMDEKAYPGLRLV